MKLAIFAVSRRLVARSSGRVLEGRGRFHFDGLEGGISTISFYDRPLRNRKDYRFSLVRSKLLIQHFEFKYSVVRVKVGRKIISDPRFRLGGEETCEYLREGRLSWLSIHLSIYREEWTFARRCFLSSTLFLSSPFPFPSNNRDWIVSSGLP